MDIPYHRRQILVRSPQVVEFLSHLMRYIPEDLLVIWDGLRSHRSRLVKNFVAQQTGRIELESLPAYAPELNPVEYLWGYWKQHELPNFCPKTFTELSFHAVRALKRMRRRPQTDYCFLETGRIVLILKWSLYYTKINS